MARPSLCVALLATLIFLTTTTSASALLTPILTETKPLSPGTSFTPRVKGRVEVVDTKVAILRGAGPITRDEDLTNMVKLYTVPGCTGTVVGEGPVSQLKGEGIQVAPVDADSVTFFYANQTDGIVTSECSNGLRYRQVTTAPDAPVFDSVSPASPANDNVPHLIGSADPDATVWIYDGPECMGVPLASGSGFEFGSAGIQVTVQDNSETTFSAIVSLNAFDSPCSAESIVYREVTPPPDPGGGGTGGGGGGSGGAGGGGSAPSSGPPPPAPRLRTLPGGWANDNTPLVTGTAPAAQTVRVYADPNCGGSAVASGSAAAFAAGLPVQVVDNDVTVLSGVSIAGAKVSACSDPVVYIEDSLTPHTRITMGPASKTAKRKAIFRFMDTTGNAPGTKFLCRVDVRKWTQCASPLRLRNLKPRRYTVQVKATDAAGNVEAKGAKRRFKVVPRS